MTTGQRMKERRKQIGISAETVASRLGVSPATIYRYENGGIDNVPGDILAPIAEILQTTPAYLMGLESEEKDTSDEMLAFMEHLSYEQMSGREDARTAMLNTHGIENGTHISRNINGKHVFLYYHAFDDNRNSRAASSLMELLEKLSPKDAEHLELLVEAYTAADDRARQMVDLALDPFLSKDTKDWVGSLVPDGNENEGAPIPDAATPALARQILWDKKAEESDHASSGDGGKENMA